MLAHSGLRHRAESYVSNLALIWLALAFYRANSYYAGFLRPETQQVLLWMAIAYTALGFLFQIVLPFGQVRESKGATLIKTLWRLSRETKAYIANFTLNPGHPLPRIDPYEKTVLLFVLVKIFFLPLMINFLFGSLYDLQSTLGSWQARGFALTAESLNYLAYPAIISLLFAVDTAYFTFGYAIESSWLRNTVRSVEPTFLGWIVTLVCYPPFNSFLGNYLGWYANDYARMPTEGLTLVLRILVIIFFLIYVWATLALGAKCSNLTNRGIVSRGPYRFVRHPAYVSKNLAWAVTVLPLLSFTNPIQSAIIIATTGAWAFIYFLRAVTEERHLIADKEYQEYCKKVKYRFIPFVF